MSGSVPIKPIEFSLEVDHLRVAVVLDLEGDVRGLEEWVGSLVFFLGTGPEESAEGVEAELVGLALVKDLLEVRVVFGREDVLGEYLDQRRDVKRESSRLVQFV